MCAGSCISFTVQTNEHTKGLSVLRENYTVVCQRILPLLLTCIIVVNKGLLFLDLPKSRQRLPAGRAHTHKSVESHTHHWKTVFMSNRLKPPVLSLITQAALSTVVTFSPSLSLLITGSLFHYWATFNGTKICLWLCLREKCVCVTVNPTVWNQKSVCHMVDVILINLC